MTSPPLAHTGHWIASLLYVVPVIVVLAALGVQVVHDRRRERRAGSEPSSEPPAASEPPAL